MVHCCVVQWYRTIIRIFSPFADSFCVVLCEMVLLRDGVVQRFGFGYRQVQRWSSARGAFAPCQPKFKILSFFLVQINLIKSELIRLLDFNLNAKHIVTFFSFFFFRVTPTSNGFLKVLLFI